MKEQIEYAGTEIMLQIPLKINLMLSYKVIISVFMKKIKTTMPYSAYLHGKPAKKRNQVQSKRMKKKLKQKKSGIVVSLSLLDLHIYFRPTHKHVNIL